MGRYGFPDGIGHICPIGGKMANHTTHNERTKLTATYINGMATALAAAGAFAPLFALIYGEASPERLRSTAIGFAICVSISLALHLLARWILGRIRP